MTTEAIKDGLIKILKADNEALHACVGKSAVSAIVPMLQAVVNLNEAFTLLLEGSKNES